MNLGGPTSEASVRPFLYNLLSDNDILRFGGGFRQKAFATVVSAIRSRKVMGRYQAINACPRGCTGPATCPNRQTGAVSTCCSPINPLTEGQRAALATWLATHSPTGEAPLVLTAMRYWHPTTESALRALVAAEVEDVVFVPLYPQFSFTTSGSSFRFWQKEKQRLGLRPRWRETFIKTYATEPLYIRALAARVREALERFAPADRNQVHLLFSAHGTPLSDVERGDPYTHEVEATVRATVAALQAEGWQGSHWLSYQSRVGLAKWTQPATTTLAQDLMEYGIRKLLVVPVAFVSDHIETLMELNIELREELQPYGVEQLEVSAGLNDHPLFIESLGRQVLRVLGPPQAEPLPEPAAVS
jgi:ferrochelatase